MAEPLIIKRDWILRASWQCAEHRLPLAALGGTMANRPYWPGLRWLEMHVAAAERLRRRNPVPLSLEQRNENLVAHLLGKSTRGMRRGEYGYQLRFEENVFHLSRARIALLLAAHSDRVHSAVRFEHFVALSAATLRKAGRGALDPTSRPIKPKAKHTPTKLEVVTRTLWLVSLGDVLRVYGSLFARSEVGNTLGARQKAAKIVEPPILP